MFRDYTLQQVAEKWDCDEALILEAFKDDSDMVRRQFGIFGPIRYKRERIDGLTSYMHSSLRSHLPTQAQAAQEKQELADLIASNEESRQRIDEKQKQRLAEHESYLNEILTAARRLVASQQEEEPPDNNEKA